MPSSANYEIYRQSKEFLPVVVDALNSDHDITLDEVWIACVDIDTEPEDSDLKSGTWDTIDGDTIAKILVGPPDGDIVLDPGDYDVYTKIGDAPEVPYIRVGLLRIT